MEQETDNTPAHVPVRVFSNDSILQAVEKALGELPPGKQGKVEVRVTGKQNAEVEFTYRVKGGFSAGGFVHYNGKVDAGGKITWEW